MSCLASKDPRIAWCASHCREGIVCRLTARGEAAEAKIACFERDNRALSEKLMEVGQKLEAAKTDLAIFQNKCEQQERRANDLENAAFVLIDLLEDAWGVISNAYSGDWTNAHGEWNRAAHTFKNRYQELTASLKLGASDTPVWADAVRRLKAKLQVSDLVKKRLLALVDCAVEGHEGQRRQLMAIIYVLDAWRAGAKIPDYLGADRNAKL